MRQLKYPSHLPANSRAHRLQTPDPTALGRTYYKNPRCLPSSREISSSLLPISFPSSFLLQRLFKIHPSIQHPQSDHGSVSILSGKSSTFCFQAPSLHVTLPPPQTLAVKRKIPQPWMGFIPLFCSAVQVGRTASESSFFGHLIWTHASLCFAYDSLFDEVGIGI